MRVFVIKDDTDISEKDLGYLFYNETTKQFHIELPEGSDPWDTPLLLSSFVSRGQYTVDAHWSLVWVKQRIIPIDRQNMKQILRDNGLNEYDEFTFLYLAAGRCA